MKNVPNFSFCGAQIFCYFSADLGRLSSKKTKMRIKFIRATVSYYHKAASLQKEKQQNLGSWF